MHDLRSLCAGGRLCSYVYVVYSELQFYPEFLVDFIRIGDDEKLRGF